MGGTEIVSSTKTGSRITSGGGFSNYFEMPDYQKHAVEGYFKSRAYLEAHSETASNPEPYPEPGTVF